jgi:hypothetical protein
MSFFQTLYSYFWGPQTSSPHTPQNEVPPVLSSSASIIPANITSSISTLSDKLHSKFFQTKCPVEKTLQDAPPLDRRIASQFEEIFRKINKPKDIANIFEIGWFAQTLHVLNLRGELKEKHFYVCNAPLVESAQVTTNPAIRMTKEGTFKAYVMCTQKDNSQNSQTAFEDGKLEIFARAAIAEAAPKIYLCPNQKEVQEEKTPSKKYQDTFVTKFIQNGDLITFLLGTETGLEERIDISKSLILQLQKLHAIGIYHRDIKLDNVLIDYSTSTVKICDYGLATDQLHSQEMPGSKEYAPPEYNQNFFAGQVHSFNNTLKETIETTFNSSKQDMFTLGLTIFATLSLSIYYDVLTTYIKQNKDQLNKTYSKCKSLEEFIEWKQWLSDLIVDKELSDYPPNIRVLVKGLIQYYPERRISFEKALEILDL